MKAKHVRLGYAVGSGDPVDIPLHHVVVTGLTQLSGKTTTLEALIARSGLRALAFRTKRGETDFEGAHRHAPFFREKADWQYVQGLLEATMRERMRFERSWIIKATKGARSLRDVYRNVSRELVKAKGLSESVYTNLKAYLEIVLPQLEATPFAAKLELRDGVNVMDLVGLRDEVQSLVIASTLEAVYDGMRDTIVVIPEAWKFVPEGRGDPVKRAADRFIRQGAAIGLYLWFDSQDIAGMDKGVLKNVDTWILGRQKEINEVEHTLAQVPLPRSRKPAPEDVMNLPLGRFYAVYAESVKKVYVWPVWITPELAREIARGEAKVAEATALRAITRPKREMDDLTNDEREELVRLRRELAEVRTRLEETERKGRNLATSLKAAVEETVEVKRSQPGARWLEEHAEEHDNGAFGPAMPRPAEAQLEREEAVNLEVARDLSYVHVKVSRPTVDASDGDFRGRMALLLADGFFAEPVGATSVSKEMIARGWAKPGGGLNVAVYRELDWFTAKAFLRALGERGKRTWVAMAGMSQRIRTEEVGS